MTALVLADEALRKFGGDSLGEFVRNHDTYCEQVRLQSAHIDTSAAPDSDAAPLNWDADQAFTDGDAEPTS
jgi:hypothetical protein